MIEGRPRSALLAAAVVAAICAFVLPLAGAQGKAASAEAAFAKKYFEAFNRHDLEAVMKLYAENAVMIDPNYKEGVRGREKIREHLKKLFESIPDINDDVRNVVAESGKVAVEFVSTGTPKGAPEKFSIRIADFFELDKAGLIVRDATYFDRGG